MVKDSRFIDHNGVNVEVFTPTYIKGNGWECTMDEFGNISCISKRVYRNKHYTTKFNLKNRWVKLIRKINKERPRVLKSYQLGEVWPPEGVIGLSGACDETQRAYFRESKFQKFLDDNGLTAVYNDSANGTFALFETWQGEEILLKEEIEATDGTKELIYNDVKVSEDKKALTIERRVEVTNATWTIKKVEQADGRFHRILYTTDNPKEILNLPKK